MPSRMERYTDIKLTRTDKNKELYDELHESKDYPENKRYTNVEGVVETNAPDNIDIERIKELINRREENNRLSQRRIKPVAEEETATDYEEEEIKNYDIKDVLNKAKDERSSDKEEHHSLKNVELDILKNLNIKKTKYEEPDDELKELIDTITNTSKLNKLGDKELSLDLLDNLKSNDNTVIGSSDAIRKVLKEEKIDEEEEGIDKSFYTKSMNLTDDLEGLVHNKNSNKTIVKIFIIISIIVAIAVGGFIIYNMIKK